MSFFCLTEPYCSSGLLVGFAYREQLETKSEEIQYERNVFTQCVLCVLLIFNQQFSIAVMGNSFFFNLNSEQTRFIFNCSVTIELLKDEKTQSSSYK